METSLAIELTEPVVPLRNSNTSERASRYHDEEMSPPTIVRGLLTLKLAKPTKISSIELELQAKATTRYTQGAGPSRLDVTEQYNVHSASTAVFEAASLAPQAQTRSASARPGVQFLDEYIGSRAFHRAENGHWQAPSDPHPANRSISLDPGSLRVARPPNPGDIDIGRNYQQAQVTSDPAPPYPGSAGRHPFSPNAETYLSATEQITIHRSPVRSRNRITPDISYRSPASSVLSLREYALSRASSMEELPEDDNESFEHASALPSDNITYYGLSRIATASSGRSSEQDYRGRSHSRFSLGNIVHVFDAVKDQHEQERRGRSLVKGKGKPQVNTYGVSQVLHQIGVAEPPVADGANDQSGGGWIVFPQGTYTYPIFFTIPNDSPPTSIAHHGSLTWQIKADVKRPGVFTTRLTAQKEVIVVSLPKHSNPEEGIDLQRPWEDQFQYRVQIGGHAFPIGGKVPFQLTISPMAKIKVHSILVYLDERTDYYSRTQSQVRSDVMRRATLLAIRRSNSDERYSEPILPLISNEPDAFRKSPLHRFVGPEENENEVASSFMGSGPWTIRHDLKLPDSAPFYTPRIEPRVATSWLIMPSR
ncbi:hypothetical protein JVU11DRAFT_7379 [Chiua virens]|nr:hypothetical protein JVU11DRAFT_7379 [Chiua virens]